jgi:hypothetical protein
VPVTIWIPWGIKHTATVVGSESREVKCRGCGAVYYFILTRRAGGSRTAFILSNQRPAESTAAELARTNLRHQLRGAIDAVACPACGLFQPSMVRLIRRRRVSWAVGVGLVLGFFLLLVPMASPRWLPSACVVATALFVAAVWSALDPNSPKRREGNRENTRGLTAEGIARVREQERRRQAEREAAQLADPDQRWSCPECNLPNPNSRYRCRGCGYSLV